VEDDIWRMIMVDVFMIVSSLIGGLIVVDVKVDFHVYDG
jgi:hypothetical protein